MRNLLLFMMSFALLLTFNQCAKEGEIGPQGIQGVQGEKGEKGDKGDKGDKGNKGDKGSDGNAQVDIYIFEDIMVPNDKSTRGVEIKGSYNYDDFDKLIIFGFYKKRGNTGWFSVPGLAPNERMILQEYSVFERAGGGTLWYVIKKNNLNGTPNTTESILFERLKVVVMPGNIMTRSQGELPFDQTDYKSVAEYFGLDED